MYLPDYIIKDASEKNASLHRLVRVLALTGCCVTSSIYNTNRLKQFLYEQKINFDTSHDQLLIWLDNVEECVKKIFLTKNKKAK